MSGVNFIYYVIDATNIYYKFDSYGLDMGDVDSIWVLVG